MVAKEKASRALPKSASYVYEGFCAARVITTVPASPAAVAAFVEACAGAGKKPATIRRSKTDQAGEGHTAYLSPVTVGYLRDWLDLTQITKGSVFRRLVGTGFPPKQPPRPGREPKPRTIAERIGARLSPAAVGIILRSVAKHIKMPPDDIEGISGHSIRVGATQDLLALNIDLTSVMQAGRWKSHRMPMRYGEHVLAGLGGMARATKVQGRGLE